MTDTEYYRMRLDENQPSTPTWRWRGAALRSWLDRLHLGGRSHLHPFR